MIDTPQVTNTIVPEGPKLMTIGVVIPFHVFNSDFKRCLESVLKASLHLHEIILVDDGSVGALPEIENNSKIKIIRTSGGKGPAFARNMGVQQAVSDLVCFIDSDVLVPSDLFERIIEQFEKNKDLTALFGSYDDTPGDKKFLSQYRNLLHHYVHQTSNENASTFWTGCGAIRRATFLEMGGFNEVMYKSPEIEDIELGYRLTTAGYKIQLVKELQVKHLKVWAPLNLLKADLFYRAIPWTKLLLQQDKVPNDLNLKIQNKICVALSFCLPIFLGLSYWNIWSLLPFGIVLGLFLFLNYPLYYFFHQKRGKRFLLKALPWHWLFYVISGLGFILGHISHYSNSK